MSLIGQRFGAYHVQALLGVGAMGEVYRAHDTRLGRDVALKVLPPDVTADRDRLARFEREARTLASLNHPHIGAIYGLEDGIGDTGRGIQALEDRREEPVTNLVGRRGALGYMPTATDGTFVYFPWRDDLGDVWVMDVEP